jgi:glycosyltransferase involved in cell wall biosynthesis
MFLTRFDLLGASSRLRTFQFIPSLEQAGIECEVHPLFSDASLSHKYSQGHYGMGDLLHAYFERVRVLIASKGFDIFWIEKEALPWFPVWLERRILRGTPYVLDFDDAIFHNYDLHGSALVRYLFGARIDRLMASSCLVIAGNRYLADRALAAGASRVEVLPTVVDLTRYSPKATYRIQTKPRVVWIGSPSTLQYLRRLSRPLAELARRRPFTLRVIADGVFTIPNVDVESLAWSIDMEASAIAGCDIGIMPLHDSPWEQGKCAYKLIQYMACGLPTIASPIGANRDVLVEGETGFFADDPQDWLDRLETLLDNEEMRERMGRAGRQRTAGAYSLQVAAPKLSLLLKTAAIRQCVG